MNGLAEVISSGVGGFHSRVRDGGVQGGLLSWGSPRGAQRPTRGQQLTQAADEVWAQPVVMAATKKAAPREHGKQSGQKGHGVAVGMAVWVGGHPFEEGPSHWPRGKQQVHLNPAPGSAQSTGTHPT